MFARLKLSYTLKSFADSSRFSSKVVLYLAPSIFPSTLTSFPVPAEEKQPHNMMLPPPCLTVWMARFVQCTTNCCPMDRLPHLSCGSLQLLQSYRGRLGCVSDQCSPSSALCSLDFMMLFTDQCPLSKPLRPSQNSCIHTKTPGS
ncbi:uncharacterized protein LOC129187227 isoform X9 [Dunckerocampus dactyliophorus]|uniref:uncharacterized protein LOC129187227 isoform X9 n=1 Tax=Dunckerocampus dactyliophorus TaxID=161453 RepID=UPI002406F0E6|nr:uncharacterized protein LOC129187227 isoform X9 [Dunckerocampus dactyliophorus]